MSRRSRWHGRRKRWVRSASRSRTRGATAARRSRRSTSTWRTTRWWAGGGSPAATASPRLARRRSSARRSPRGSRRGPPPPHPHHLHRCLASFLEGGALHVRHAQTQRHASRFRRRSGHSAAVGHPRGARAYRYQVRMRHCAVRRLHGPRRRADVALLLGAGLGGGRSAGDDDRGSRVARREGGAKSVGGPRRRAVRLLPVGTDHVGDRPAGEEAQPERYRHRPRHGRQHLSLRDLPAHPRGDPRRVGAARGLRRRVMHPLMNRLHTDERRRLMGLLGVKESDAPLLSRRVFLQSAGATGLVIGSDWLAPNGAEAALPGAEGAATGPLAPNAFIRVGTDNLVTVICKHHEMGQGNTTGLAALVADELDADWSLVRTEYAPSDPKLYNNLAFGEIQGTGGSSAIANSFLQYRSAGATARAMLVAAAAEAWQVPAGEIRALKSTLTHASGRRATYGEMAVGASRETPPGNPPLKRGG